MIKDLNPEERMQIQDCKMTKATLPNGRLTKGEWEKLLTCEEAAALIIKYYGRRLEILAD